MAGSYKHVVATNGFLGSNEHVVSMLENGGDVFEAVQEMYGMIWWLASELVNQDQIAAIALEMDPTDRVEAIKAAVERARRHYEEGLTFSKEIHRLSPDKRRD